MRAPTNEKWLALERLMRYCWQCGTPLVPWKPAIFGEGGAIIAHETTPHKWCPSCLNVTYRLLEIYLADDTESKVEARDA